MENDQTSDSQSTPAEISHTFVEVGSELLSKPSALCDLLEARGSSRAIVFCNNPSDTDFVEVILKKRGLNACKLIGFVSPEKLDRALTRIDEGELAALVVTDIAARSLDLSKFETIANYSLPGDVDSYLSRAGTKQGGKRTVISLVAPLDIAAFHQIKKGSELSFSQTSLPTAEDLAKARVANLKKSAAARSFDATILGLAKSVLKDGSAEGIVAFLLQNNFELVPQLQATIEKLTWERENLDDEDSEQPDRNGGGRFDRRDSRGGGRDRGGDRDHRGGDRDDNYGNRGGRDRGGMRGDDRGGRDDRGQGRDGRGGDRDNRGRDSRGGGRGDDRGPRRNDRQFEDRGHDRGGDDYQGGQQGGDDGDQEYRQRPQVIRTRDERLYIGKGKKQGFSKEEFEGMLQSKADVDPASIKRFYLRSNYAFADFAEGVGDQVIKSFDPATLLVTKAISVVTVQEGTAEEAGADTSSEGNGNYEEGEGASEGNA